jgi:hypothetical protein
MVFRKHIGVVFGALLELADEDPIGAVQGWIAELDRNKSTISLDDYARGLSRIVARARRATIEASVSELERVVATANQSIELIKKCRGVSTGLGFTLGTATAEPIERSMPSMNARPSPDLVRLDHITSSWSFENWCEWLNTGFSAIDEGDSTAHLAFPPLRLYPIGRLVEQLATAFAEASEFGSLMRESIRSAVGNYLAKAGSGEFSRDALFWKFFSLLDPKDPNVHVGRSYVIQVMKSSNTKIPDAILDIICTFGWDCAADSSARAYFYEWLADVVDSSIVIARGIAAGLDEAVSDKELLDETLRYAASKSLVLIPPGVSLVSSQLDRLIFDGRFQKLSPYISQRVVRNTEELRSALSILANGLIVGEKMQWTPPEPKKLADQNIQALVEA